MAKKPMPLKIIPLGGLDGIGKNMTVFEYGTDMVLIDAGLMFPDDSQPGIDLVLPDYSYVIEHEDMLRAILITHGHEDHTGALPYLLDELDVEISLYASKLTLGIIWGKLSEHSNGMTRFCEVKNGTHLNLGAFSVDFFSVTHSIPGALGIYLRTPAGSVLHTGDFKLDQTPIDSIRPNYQAINRYATMGIDLLMSDSTNANLPGFTPSEATVGPVLHHIIKNAPGRVFVACFSSHIHRLQQICDAATSVGRKVVVTGRSMVTNTRVARELGYLHIDEDNIVDAYDVGDIPDNQIVVLCTGSQGEPMSALSRMANGEHKSLRIIATDTVIISATPVPGNERSVQGIINALSKIGCSIYDKNNATVHVSGHGRAEELKLMIAMCQPYYFMPVHGEAIHLRAHGQLAHDMGIQNDHIFIATNGDALQMIDGRVGWGEPVESGVIYVDGLSVTDANPVVLRDRKKLGKDGIITCVVVFSRHDRRVTDVEVSARGVSWLANEHLLSHAQDFVRTELDSAIDSDGANIESMQRYVRGSLLSFLWAKTHTRPMVIPVVMEV